ncbi:MAG: WbqC family protein [Opitutus sp.]|nr:WbqC family protein [Opitutus sp.]MCS6248594.1 WbqC family protein [Opitutus sp.]MCS6274305.1 WbqC family protein [Opitutus sp.]MCS6278614.1 WbqC family protein [Opitutus sp.]MCS6298485.1 WbqC family protein [Opitutus sp.]
MIVSIMQPAYLPWLGYFDRIAKSDLHIVLDDVAIDANSKTKFANRNKIRTPDGWIWLTVPLRSKGKHGNLLLSEAEITPDTPWRQKHLGALQSNYTRTPYFAEHRAYFGDIYARDWAHLDALTAETTGYLRGALGITCPIQRSSAMNASGEKDALILNLCREVGATTYISGPFGREYLDAAAFAAAGIQLVFHDYAHPEYAQGFPGFEPYMSVVDLLCTQGPAAGDILRSSETSLVKADLL